MWRGSFGTSILLFSSHAPAVIRSFYDGAPHSLSYHIGGARLLPIVPRAGRRMLGHRRDGRVWRLLSACSSKAANRCFVGRRGPASVAELFRSGKFEMAKNLSCRCLRPASSAGWVIDTCKVLCLRVPGKSDELNFAPWVAIMRTTRRPEGRHLSPLYPSSRSDLVD